MRETILLVFVVAKLLEEARSKHPLVIFCLDNFGPGVTGHYHCVRVCLALP